MAINLFNKYGSRANPPSIDYPQGSVKNRTAPDVKDGTPLDADWANDHQGFFQSILSYFGVTANGTPDKVGASQYFDALMSDPTEARRGMPLVATNTEVSSGLNKSKMVTPSGLQSAFLNNANLSENGYQRLPSGLIMQWLAVQMTNYTAGSENIASLPIAFPNNAFCASATMVSGGSTAFGMGVGTVFIGKSQVRVCVGSTAVRDLTSAYVIAIGN